MTRRGDADPRFVKRTSVLRRVPPIAKLRVRTARGLEGDVCLFELRAAAPIEVEAESGRVMTLLPGDRFLAVPGHRESTRWVVGGIPDHGLRPGRDYWVLADSGVVGALIVDSPREKGHLAPARFLGTVSGRRGKTLNLRQFVEPAAGLRDMGEGHANLG